MILEKELLKYFKELGETEKIIVIGKAAELYRERMLEMNEFTLPAPGYSATAEEIREAMSKTGKLEKVVREYKIIAPAQSEKDILKLVLERAREIGKATL